MASGRILKRIVSNETRNRKGKKRREQKKKTRQKKKEENKKERKRIKRNEEKRKTMRKENPPIQYCLITKMRVLCHFIIRRTL